MDTDAHKIFDCSSGCRLNEDKPIVVGNNVWFGMGSSTLKGVSIADGCVIAAGSIITKNINIPNSIAGGNPAQILKTKIEWKQ